MLLRSAALLASLVALAACEPINDPDSPGSGTVFASADTAAGEAGVLGGRGLEGTLRIATTPALLPVAQTHAARFGASYPNATITATAMTAREALAAVQAGRADAALIDREPTDAEREALTVDGVAPVETLLGADAVVAVAAAGSAQQAIRVADVLAAVRGTGPFRAALASRNTGAADYLATRAGGFRPQAPFPTEREAIAYAASHPDAVAFVGRSAVPDSLNGLRLVPLVDSTGARVTASSRSVFEGRYPLAQPIVLVSRIAGSRAQRALASGFGRFAASTPGQESILRAGFAPATLPQREVQLVGPDGRPENGTASGD